MPAKPNGPIRAVDHRAQRILEVAERLFAEKGVEHVTVRDIADEAGVTHPLIYHHWGSKQGLLAAVLERNQGRMRRVADGDGDARQIIDALVRENLSGSRLYLLTLARAFLSGTDPTEWPGGFPAIEAGLSALQRARGESAETPEVDRELREVIMAVVALQTGWVLLEEQLLTITGLEAADRDEARERMLNSVQRMLDQVLPPATI